MDHKLFSCAISIDLKKAFDTVQHSILLRKLEFYGVRGLVNDWFGSYLSNRNQTTEINGYISTKEIKPCGVPKGSVLGPLLLLLFINDRTNSSTKLKYFLFADFADGTGLLYANRNLNLLKTTINAELKLICEWLIANKLTLNIKKGNFVLFRPYQKKVTSPLNITLFDNGTRKYLRLECKDSVKYLGLLIDSRLSWRSQNRLY